MYIMTCCYINKTGLKLIAVCNDSRNYLKKHAAQYTSAACHICNSSKKKLKDILKPPSLALAVQPEQPKSGGFHTKWLPYD